MGKLTDLAKATEDIERKFPGMRSAAKIIISSLIAKDIKAADDWVSGNKGLAENNYVTDINVGIKESEDGFCN